MQSVDPSDEEAVSGAPLEHPTVPEVIAASKLVAAEIVSGKTDPYEGAKRIWILYNQARPEEHLVDLDPFVYWASEWEDRPEDEAFIANAIRVNARHLIGMPDTE